MQFLFRLPPITIAPRKIKLGEEGEREREKRDGIFEGRIDIVAKSRDGELEREREKRECLRRDFFSYTFSSQSSLLLDVANNRFVISLNLFFRAKHQSGHFRSTLIASNEIKQCFFSVRIIKMNNEERNFVLKMYLLSSFGGS